MSKSRCRFIGCGGGCCCIAARRRNRGEARELRTRCGGDQFDALASLPVDFAQNAAFFFFLISPGGHTQPPPVGELRRSGSDWPTLRGSILHRLGRVGAGEGRHVEEAVVELHRDEVGEQHGGEVGKRSSEECWSAPSVGAPPEAYCGPAGSILVGIARLSYHFAQVPPLSGSAIDDAARGAAHLATAHRGTEVRRARFARHRRARSALVAAEGGAVKLFGFQHQYLRATSFVYCSEVKP